MNQNEKICQSHQRDVSCFQTIPERFEFDGKTNKSCSFAFPQGYSIYVEELILNDPGPDNFVLVDEKIIEYNPKITWRNRQQIFWSKLDESHSLKKKSNRRSNFPCVKKLKVTEHQNYFRELIFYFYYQTFCVDRFNKCKIHYEFSSNSIL